MTPQNMESVHIHTSPLVDQRDLLQNKPIAFLQLENGEFVIDVAKNNSLKLCIGSFECEKCGLYYFKWKIDERAYHRHFNVKRSCILLPILSKHGIVHKQRDSLHMRIYTAIAHDYTELDMNGEFVKASLNSNDLL